MTIRKALLEVKVLEAKVLEVTAEELNVERNMDGEVIESYHTFIVHEFSNGLIMIPDSDEYIIPDSTEYSWFFSARGDIDAGGSRVVTCIVDTSTTVNYTQDEFLEVVIEAQEWYGVDSVPDSYKELLVV